MESKFWTDSSDCHELVGEVQTEEVRTQTVRHGVPNVHPAPPQGRAVLSDMQLDLGLEWFWQLALRRAGFAHSDISARRDRLLEVAKRGGYDRFGGIIACVPRAQGGRADV